MTVKLLDLVPQYESIQGEIRAAIDEVLSTQQFILGAKVEELERDRALVRRGARRRRRIGQ